MEDRDLKIKVFLEGIDKLTKPIRDIQAKFPAFNKELQSSASNLNNLHKIQNNIGSYQQQQSALDLSRLKFDLNKKSLDALADKLKQTTKPSQSLTNEYNRLEQRSLTLSQSISNQTNKLNLQSESLKRQNIDVKHLSNSQVTLQGAINKTVNSIGKQSDSIESTKIQLNQLNRQSKQLNHYNKLSDKFKTNNKLLNQQSNQLKELKTAFNATNTPSKTLINNIEQTTNRMERLKLTTNQQKNDLKQLTQLLNTAGIKTDSFASSQSTLATRVESTNTHLRHQTSELNKQQALNSKREGIRNRMNRSLDTLSDISLVAGPAMQVGMGMAKSIISPIIASANFEAETVRTGAVSGSYKGSDNYKLLHDSARELGRTTAHTAVQVQQGQRYLAMMGMAAKDIVTAMPSVLSLDTISGGIGLDRTADISSNILSGFGLKAEQLESTVDKMAATLTNSNVDLVKLGHTMKYVAPSASAANISAADTMLLTGTLGNSGIQGSQAGTGLKAIITRLAAPPKAAMKALSKLDVDATYKDNKGRKQLRPILDVIKDIQTKIKKFGNADQLDIMKGIAGLEALPSLQTLVKKTGDADFKKLQKAIHGADKNNDATTMSKAILDNLKGDVKILKSAVADVAITTGDLFNPIAREATIQTTLWTQKMGDWIRANPMLTKGLLTVVTVLGVLIATMGALSLVLVAVGGSFAMFRYAMAMARLEIPLFIAKVKMMSASLINLSKQGLATAILQLKSFRLAMLATPWGIGIAALVAGATLIKANWGGISSYFDSAVNAFNKTQKITSNTSKVNWLTVDLRFSETKNKLKKTLQPMLKVFSTEWNKLTNKFSFLKILESDAKFSGKKLGELLSHGISDTLPNLISDLFIGIGRVIESNTNNIRAFTDGISFGFTIINESAKITYRTLRDIASKTASWANNNEYLNSTLTALKQMLAPLGNGLLSITDSLGLFNNSSDQTITKTQRLLQVLGMMTGILATTFIFTRLATGAFFLAIGLAKVVFWLGAFIFRAVILNTLGLVLFVARLGFMFTLLSSAIFMSALSLLGIIGRLTLLMGLGIIIFIARAASTFMMLGRAIGFVSMMLLANPIVLIVMAIIAAIGLLAYGVYQIYNNWGAFKKWWEDLWASLENTVKKRVNAIRNLTSELANIAKNMGGNLKIKAENFGARIFGGEQKPEVDIFTGSSPVDSLMTDSTRQRLAGMNINQGLSEGVKSSQTTINNTISQSAESAQTLLKDKWGIRSPSKFTEQIGLNIIQGLNNGLNKGDGIINNNLTLTDHLKSKVVNGLSSIKNVFREDSQLSESRSLNDLNKQSSTDFLQKNEKNDQTNNATNNNKYEVTFNINNTNGLDEQTLSQMFMEKLREFEHEQFRSRSNTLFDGHEV